MKKNILPLGPVILGMALSVASASTNTAPMVVIASANMRVGTTLMDVVFRVNDPDDATVKVRALAFVDGQRSFAKVIRPVTFAEGTGTKLGDAIPANTDHTITWDVAADWDIDLGQVKFEILAMDGRGLLAFDWISIPAAGPYPSVTISKNPSTTNEVLNALFWLYASGDPGLSLTNGVLSGNSNSGEYARETFASGSSVYNYATPFVFKRMNVDVADAWEIAEANTARAGVSWGWLGANRPYAGLPMVMGWGNNDYGQAVAPSELFGVTAIAAGGEHSLALRSDGIVVGWGHNYWGQPTAPPPSGLTGVTAIAAGFYHGIALKGDGTVVAWPTNNDVYRGMPAGLTGVTAIAAGSFSGLALKSDGTVAAWPTSHLFAQVPAGLTGVIAIAGGYEHSMALKSDGTIVCWGTNLYGQMTPPPGLTGVVAIGAGQFHSIALKSDGTVVGWGSGNATPPDGLTGVVAISAGPWHNLALTGDGTVVGWGGGNVPPPSYIPKATAVSAGGLHSLVLTKKNP
ncbi:MAG TPA: hypothetical protein PLU30_00685 [Verrucomicrobiae bacterium]|nr:hypothetical protein [Verrucomicrobiae bacterium]